MMLARSSSIEPLFGHLKHNRRFTRFHLRGLAGARLEILLLAICVNLGKLAKELLDLFLTRLAFLAGWSTLSVTQPTRT